MKHKPFYTFLIAMAIVLLSVTSCRKNSFQADAFAVVDKVSLSFGNIRIYNGFEITNTGDKSLNYQIDEQIDWLEISNPTGQVAGNSSTEITCKVSRTGLPQQNYHAVIAVNTSTGSFTIDVFMMVDMYLLTFINPVFTTINLKIDTTLSTTDTSLFTRRIGKNDSIQFGFFTPPGLVVYYAQTFGQYTDSTQLGLKMEWKGNKFLENLENPRLFLDVSKAYFHLSIMNVFEVLNPLFVNAGSQYEFIENIFIYQSSNAFPIGYYHAFNNTTIRAYIVGSSSALTWSNGGQFTFPNTINQSVLLETYNGDTLKKKSFPAEFIYPHRQDISRHYGDVIELLSVCP